MAKPFALERIAKFRKNQKNASCGPPRIAKTPHLLLQFHDENPPCGNPGLGPEGNSSGESTVIAKSADAIRATKVNGAAGQISAWATCRAAIFGILSGLVAFVAPSSRLGGHIFS